MPRTKERPVRQQPKKKPSEKKQPRPKHLPVRSMERCTTTGCPLPSRRLLQVPDRHKTLLPYCVLCTNKLIDDHRVRMAYAIEGTR